MSEEKGGNKRKRNGTTKQHNSLFFFLGAMKRQETESVDNEWPTQLHQPSQERTIHA